MRPSDISGLEKFEGVGESIFLSLCGDNVIVCPEWLTALPVADPAEFCNWGYAVANVDARGSGHSEGASWLSQRVLRSGIDVPASQAISILWALWMHKTATTPSNG